MEQIITCINCPVGCRMTVSLNETGEVVSVSGNTCARGEKYAHQECTLPLTAEKCVTNIITEMAVMKVTDEGIVVTELHPDYTKEEVQAATGVDLIWADDLKPYDED